MSDYWIIGDDGQEYGPVPESEIHNWIADRRVDAETRIRQGVDGPWQRASEHAAFTGRLAAARRSPERGSDAPSPPACGFAIAALVCGLITLPTSCCCPLSGVPGILFAILALKRISEEPGQRGGRGPAIAGLILSLLGLLLFAGFQIAGVTFDGFLEGWKNGADR